MYVNQIPNAEKANFAQLLPLGYSNRTEFAKAIKGDKQALNNAYVNNVTKNGEAVTVYLGQTVEEAKVIKTGKTNKIEANTIEDSDFDENPC